MANEWLTMIFLGADNDLFGFGETLMTEVQRVGSSEHVTIVAQRDPTELRESSIRGKVLRGRWDKKEIGVTGGDAQAILDFVENTTANFSGDKKMLFLWDHGNGWQNIHAFEPAASLPEQLEAVVLSEALGETGVDVLCFDACLKAMIEIAFQLRNRVKYIVASQNVVPANTGWPYTSILGILNTQPQMTPEEAARAIVGTFGGAYNDSMDPVTLSALDLTFVEPTVAEIAKLSLALISTCRNGGREKVLKARRQSQSFGNPDYIDLISFCTEIEGLLPGTASALAAAEVVKNARKLVISAWRGNMPSIGGANGVSIYFPDRPLSPMYDLLDFPNRSGWSKFLSMVTPEIKAPESFVPKPDAPPPAVLATPDYCSCGKAKAPAKKKSTSSKTSRSQHSPHP